MKACLCSTKVLFLRIYLKCIKKSKVNKNSSIDKNCLTSRQADYIYKKVELWSLINKNTMKEIDSDVELDRMDNNSGDKTPIES